VRRLERAPLQLGRAVRARGEHVRRLALAQLRDVGRRELRRTGAPHAGQRVGIRARERGARVRRALGRHMRADRTEVGRDEHRVGGGDETLDEPLVEHDVAAQRDHRATASARQRVLIHDARIAAAGAPQRPQQALLGREAPDPKIAAFELGSSADHPARRCRLELGRRGGHSGSSMLSHTREPDRVRFLARAEPAITTLGHLSDLHATPVPLLSLEALRSKRALGWLSWHLRRRRRYRPAVLEALLADLAHTAPDQLAITGDLTQIALEHEFRDAAAWLARLGPPARVCAIPGNHDAYVRVPRERGFQHWSAYLASDPGEGEAYPSVRVRGEIALVGGCTAQPTPPFAATGRVGAEQLARLDGVLERLGRAGLCRIVLIHHPPVAGLTSRRRSLRDAGAFGEVLRRRGAELVLHGHLHRT